MCGSLQEVGTLQEKNAKNLLLSQNSLRNIIHRLKKLITSLPFTVLCNSVITF